MEGELGDANGGRRSARSMAWGEHRAECGRAKKASGRAKAASRRAETAGGRAKTADQRAKTGGRSKNDGQTGENRRRAGGKHAAVQLVVDPRCRIHRGVGPAGDAAAAVVAQSAGSRFVVVDGAGAVFAGGLPFHVERVQLGRRGGQRVGRRSAVASTSAWRCF